MGIGADLIHLIRDLKTHGAFPDDRSVIEIGAQQLASSFLDARSELTKLGSLFGVSTPPPLPNATQGEIVHGSLEHLAPEAPRASLFWEWLGYRYASIDIDGSPGSVPLDLNFDEVPDRERKRYAIVTNFGTTEHVANQANAFQVIHDLTAIQGLMIHQLPAQGMFNHGLVNYNPKFFWMLARSNGYSVVHFDFGADTANYGVPENILNFAETYAPSVRQRLAGYQASDCYLMVVLRKVFDIDYVPPIDVPSGAETGNAMLKKRYWTVFTPDAFTPKGAKALPYLILRVFNTPPSRWWSGALSRVKSLIRKF